MANQETLEVDDFNHSQAIKAALHYTIGEIVQEVGTEYKLTFSKPVIATFTEFISRQVEIYALDLEAFAKHARRTNIKCEDVKLLARRNDKLKEIMKEMADSLETSSTDLPNSKRGRKRKIEKTEMEELDNNEELT